MSEPESCTFLWSRWWSSITLTGSIRSPLDQIFPIRVIIQISPKDVVTAEISCIDLLLLEVCIHLRTLVTIAKKRNIKTLHKNLAYGSLNLRTPTKSTKSYHQKVNLLNIYKVNILDWEIASSENPFFFSFLAIPILLRI